LNRVVLIVFLPKEAQTFIYNLPLYKWRDVPASLGSKCGW